MKKLNDKQTQYDSIVEFGILGKDDETINISTLIATKNTNKKNKKSRSKQNSRNN